MFMFRSRRANLTKRLVKVRKRRGNERRPPDDEAKGVAALLKRLQDNQLEMLLAAVETRGQDVSNCILLPRDRDEDLHLSYCQVWRWPDLRQALELRRLPLCRSSIDPVYICCNPYHWSRLCQPESPPPPPYTPMNMDMLKPEDRAPSEVPLVCRDSCLGSLTTNGESCMSSTDWCKLAYWELAQRVGPLYPVESTAVNVFGYVPNGNGLSLENLASRQNYTPPEPVTRTRCKIGLGVTLSREVDGIWLYNRSEHAVFVNSLTLEESHSPSPTKVPEGHCLCVFDPVRAAHENFGWDFASCGPIDRNSIRISFVKGWGPGYCRREITACPCWLEVLLAPCR